MDLKYLTIEDLEKLAENLRKETEEFEAMQGRRWTTPNTFVAQSILANKELIEEIETEIIERTVLGVKTDGGVSN